MKSVSAGMPFDLPPIEVLTEKHTKYSELMSNHVAKLLPAELNGTNEYLNIGLSVSGFVDLPKQNVMSMWSKMSKVNKNNKQKMNQSRINVDVDVDESNNSNKSKKSKKRKKGAMFQYLDKRKEPPIKRRKLNNEEEESKENVVCSKCKNVICWQGDANRDRLVQTHMDEHLANELSKKINVIPQRVHKNVKKQKKKTGILNYFQQKK